MRKVLPCFLGMLILLVPVLCRSVEVRDFAGRKVRIEGAQRVVAVGPGVLRLLLYLGVTQRIVGIEEAEKRWDPIGKDYSMTEAFKGLEGLPVIGPGGPGKPPVAEQIISVKPDLVVMSSVLMEVYDPDRLQDEVGCPVLVVSLGPAGYVDVQGLRQTFGMLGKALGVEERAGEVVRWMESIVEDLGRRTSNLGVKPRVYIGAVSFKGAQPFTSTQYPYPPLLWLNTPSVTDRYARSTGFLSLDFEVFYREQPQVVFIDEGNLLLVKQDFDKDPERYCMIEAFKKGRIYGLLPFNYYWTNISTALSDAYYIGKVLYPDRFKDVDPVKKADEIFEAFLGEPLYEKFLSKYPGFVGLTRYFGCR